MIGAPLLAVTLLTASFAMHEVAYAKETSVNISGKQYELAEKSKYDYDDGTTPTIISSSGSQFGLFGMSGDLKVLSETNGFSSYEVSSGLVTFSYSPSDSLEEDEDELADEFEYMDEDERRETLEDAGLDPDDYDDVF